LDRTLYITIDEKPKRQAGRPLKRLRNIAEKPSPWLLIAMMKIGRGLARSCCRERPSYYPWAGEHARAKALLRRRYRQLNAMHIESLPVIAVRVEDARSARSIAIKLEQFSPKLFRPVRWGYGPGYKP
jgi:hypothetical protein